MARLSADELIDGGDVTTSVSTVQTDYGNRGMSDSVIPATGTSAADLAAAINYSPESAAVASAGAKQPDVVVDPLRNKSVKPDAPAGKQYIWIGGTDSGQWQLYSTPQGPTGGPTSGPTDSTTGSTTTPTKATGSTNAAPSTDQNALQLLTATLTGYGLSGDIASGITGLLQKGYTSDTIKAVIQDPSAVNSSDPSIKSLASAWQTRFSANTARQQAGLPVLDPATYLATEQQYKSVMLRAGLPTTAITNDYIGKLMSVDVSPAEVQQRIDAATTAVNSEDPYVIQQLNQMGLGTGDMVFHLLDPATASNIVAQKVQAAQVGAEAARAGVNTTQDYAMQLAAAGVTQAQAQTGFQNIAQQLPATQALANRYQGYGTAGNVGQELQTAVFGQPGTQTQAQAQAELERLKTQEISAFSGSSGAGKGSLGISDTSGLQ